MHFLLEVLTYTIETGKKKGYFQNEIITHVKK